MLFRTAPLRYLSLLAGCWLLVFTLTRLVLLVASGAEAEPGPGSLLEVLLGGLLYDTGFLACALLPLACGLFCCPARLWAWRGFRGLLGGLLAFSLYLMLFGALAEWLFWDEFGVRFNFIAVDYLVYSTEVISNILESYPVWPLLGALALLTGLLLFVLRRPLRRVSQQPPASLRQRGLALGLLLGLALLAVTGLDQNWPRTGFHNLYQQELASNGPWQLFAAFRNNELDYARFYPTLPAGEVARLLRAELAEPGVRFTGRQPLDLRRQIDNPGTFRPLNIVLVTVESLSAHYLGRGLTPNLDQLRPQSRYFSNLYATGTRTDRGLEAITLSVPPTPGRSIVKRLGRESGFASLGQQLAARGYDSVFLYGGRGYFDNMNAFFSGNGYRIVDQTSTAEADIHFRNAWGMADEDLYRLALREADADWQQQRPFLLQLMTTSNHRPYTYPEQRIDIPSGTGRHGAVKYSDWALGQFLAEARQKSWFSQTLFVIVADHCAGSAGREDLPVANYHIPLFIYAPGLIRPGDEAGLASQIDLAPTLLGLLNLDYVSSFFGRNLLQDSGLPPRALVANYQHLGLFDGQDLAILSPGRAPRRHEQALGRSLEQPAGLQDPLVRRDIAWYQAASHAYGHHLLDWAPPPPGPATDAAR